MTDLDAALELVEDRSSFLAFVRALIADREAEVRDGDPSEVGWAHGTIEGYLDGAVAWAEDHGPRGLPEDPSWRAFAAFLYAGMVCE